MHQVYEESEYEKLEGDFCVKIKRTDDALHRNCYACIGIVIIPLSSSSPVLDVIICPLLILSSPCLEADWASEPWHTQL